MKARLEDYVIAESGDIVEEGGYRYFPNADVRLDWLERAEKTASDRACPHGVQFYASASGTRSRSSEPYSHTGSFSSAASAVMALSSFETNSA
jgi:uncharacterized protein (DUF427 family)